MSHLMRHSSDNFAAQAAHFDADMGCTGAGSAVQRCSLIGPAAKFGQGSGSWLCDYAFMRRTSQKPVRSWRRCACAALELPDEQNSQICTSGLFGCWWTSGPCRMLAMREAVLHWSRPLERPLERCLAAVHARCSRARPERSFKRLCCARPASVEDSVRCTVQVLSSPIPEGTGTDGAYLD